MNVMAMNRDGKSLAISRDPASHGAALSTLEARRPSPT